MNRIVTLSIGVLLAILLAFTLAPGHVESKDSADTSDDPHSATASHPDANEKGGNGNGNGNGLPSNVNQLPDDKPYYARGMKPASTFVEFHNNSDESVNHIKFDLKRLRYNVRLQDFGTRLTAKEIKIRNADGSWSNVDFTGLGANGATITGGPGPQGDVDDEEGTMTLELAQPWWPCQVIRVELDVAIRHELNNHEWVDSQDEEFLGLFENWDDWEIPYNATLLSSQNLAPIRGKKLGRVDAYSAHFDTHGIDPDPLVVEDVQTPAVFDAPDLVVAEVNNRRLVAGTVEFVALGSAFFVPDTPSVLVVDQSTGQLVTDIARIELGAVHVTNGRVHVPILYRDEQDAGAVAIVVQGIRIDVPAMWVNQRIGYLAGGTATDGRQIEPATLVMTSNVTTTVRLGAATATYQVDQETHGDIVSHGPWALRVEDNAPLGGYTRGIVLVEALAGRIDAGTIHFTPLDGFSIEEDQATGVYFLEADSNDPAANIFSEVSLETTADGGAVITLGERLDTTTRIKLVLANVKLDLGQGPTTDRGNFRLGIGGTALPNPVGMALLAEGSTANEGDTPIVLPESPRSYIAWQQAAGFEEEEEE